MNRAVSALVLGVGLLAGAPAASAAVFQGYANAKGDPTLRYEGVTFIMSETWEAFNVIVSPYPPIFRFPKTGDPDAFRDFMTRRQGAELVVVVNARTGEILALGDDLPPDDSGVVPKFPRRD